MGGLVERAGELSAIRDVLARALDGSGTSLLVTGPAGIGRSALAARAQEVARGAGFTVLSSSPTPVSPALPHGVVRDWLGPLVRAGRPGAPPFDGPAADLASAMAASSVDHPVWNLAALDYAMTWALESLSRARPLLLVVDDVQWLDVASLQLLDLLSARLGPLPVVLFLTLRSGEPCHSADIVERVAARAAKLTPAALSVSGVEQLHDDLAASGPVGDLPAQEVHRLTGGLPFLVKELLRAGALEPVPHDVVEWVRERLARLGEVAARVARATAVLGEDAHLDALAALSDLGVAGLADPLEVLTAADLLATGMWRARPAYPVLGEALLAGMTPSERSDLHRAAAAHLGTAGAPAHVVAEHLVHTLPAEDAAVVDLLASAGAAALEDGAPETAARFLLRSAAETRPDDTSWDVLSLAASANFMAGLPAEAFDLWSRAVERARDPDTRSRLLVEVGDARSALGCTAEASHAYRRAAHTLSEHGRTASPPMSSVRLRRSLLRAWCDGAGEVPPDVLASTLARPSRADTHADRLLLALAGFDLAVGGEDRATARELALRALADGALLAEEAAHGTGFSTASAVLTWADAYAEALQALNAAVKDGHERGSVIDIATASYLRGVVHFREGRLRQAHGDFQPALHLRTRGWSEYAEPAVAVAALTHVALGQYDEALALEPALRAAAARGHFAGALPLSAAGLVRATRGDHEQAVQDFRRAGRLMGPHSDNGSVVEWRELSVWSLRALGRRAEALAVAEEALHHAGRWGAPRALGFALRALAQVTPRDRAVELLREALAHFDAGGCADYRARAWADLGGLLLEGAAEERQEGVDLLRRALGYGRANQVPSAVQRATRLLVGAGEQVTDPAVAPAALTRGESRVVELAVAGETNRQIAQKLAVTVKAVEWHLSNAYRKLGISSRAELSAAVYGEDEPSNSSAM
jgi:tetratricopeptide (TPR) repeat protein